MNASIDVRSFREKLEASQVDNGSILCVELSPRPEWMPVEIKDRYKPSATCGLEFWMTEVAKAVACDCSALFFDRAAWLGFSLDPNYPVYGDEAMKRVINTVRNRFPQMPIIVSGVYDGIGRGNPSVVLANFGTAMADAVTLCPYAGVMPFQSLVAMEGKGVLAVCYTGASPVVEDVPVHGSAYWLYLVKSILDLTRGHSRDNLGFVMPAAYKSTKRIHKGYGPSACHLSSCRLVAPKSPIFIPEIGDDSQCIDSTISAGWAGYGSLFISPGPKIIFGGLGEDYLDAVKKQVKSWRGKLNCAAEKLRNAKMEQRYKKEVDDLYGDEEGYQEALERSQVCSGN